MTSKNPSAITRLILVRHGESEGNRDRTFTQSSEVPLTELGREQAQKAAARIAARYRPARLVASPFARAHATAQIIAEPFGLGVELEPELREQSFGIFAGKPYTAMLGDAAYHEGPRWSWRPAEGESLLDVAARAVPAFQRVTEIGAGIDTIVVSHGGVMLALCAFVLGTWEGVEVTPNAGIVVVEHIDGRYSQPVALGDSAE